VLHLVKGHHFHLFLFCFHNLDFYCSKYSVRICFAFSISDLGTLSVFLTIPCVETTKVSVFPVLSQNANKRYWSPPYFVLNSQISSVNFLNSFGSSPSLALSRL